MRENNINILTPGEKIKKIRKDFNIKQNEITGGKITRNLISLVENNKAELTDSTANIISDCINRICKERSIDFTMTPQDLLLNNTMQADKILDDLISTVKANSHNTDYDFSLTINKSEELIKKNPCLVRIAELYKEIGDAFLNRNAYWNAYIYFFKSYEHLNFEKERNQVILVAISLSFCCNNLCKFSEAIQIIDTVLSLNIETSEINKYKLYINKAISQKNLNQHINALNSLHEIDDNIIDDKKLFNIKTLEANCYRGLQLYKEALDIQLNLLNSNCANDITKRLIILCNIIDIYKCIHNTPQVKQYLNIAANILKDSSVVLNSAYSHSIYYDMGINNLYIDNCNEATFWLKRSLSESKLKKAYKVEFDSLDKLFSIYKDQNDIKKLEEIKIDLTELISKDNRPEYHTLIYKFISMYSMQNKKDDLDSLVSFALNLRSSEEQ